MDDYEKRVIAYQLAMSLARNMVSQGIISEEEYRKIDTIMTEKHGLFSGTIFR